MAELARVWGVDGCGPSSGELGYEEDDDENHRDGRSSSVRRSRLLIPIALFAAGLVLGGAGLRWLIHQGLAEFWDQQCASVSDEQALPLMRQLVAGDRLRLRYCVAALGQPRPALAEAARRALVEKMAAWRQRPATESIAWRQWLAEALAQTVDQLPDERRGDAAEMARAILSWPDAAPTDGSRLLADCEYVLRADAQRGAHASSGPTESSDAVQTGRARTDEETAARALLAWTRLAGGALPTSPVESPVVASTTAAPAELPRAPETEPGLLSAAANARPSESLRQPSALLASPDDERQGAGSSHRTAGRPAPRPAEVRRLSLDQPEQRRELQSVQTRELIHRLQSSDTETSSLARIELEARGFTKIDFELARRLEAPDAEARRQLVEALPDLPGAQATPWLLWLCEDPDPDVALAAVTWLATTGNPAVWAQLESVATRQSDPRILRVLEQCQQRRRTGRTDRGR